MKMYLTPFPTIVLVGRMNVGKSTLFNRLTEHREALVSAIPGTTRDRRYGEVVWRGQTLRLVDTGGVESLERAVAREGAASNAFLQEIKEQVAIAIHEADLLLFLVDGKEGLLPQDITLAQELKKIGKPVLLAANKVANPARADATAVFWKLGLGNPHAIAALSGKGTGDLLDAAMQALPKQRISVKNVADQIAGQPMRIALMGKPNVGKSSLFNALLGEKRAIVSPLPGTTREVQDTLVTYDGNALLFLDTVGLRRKKTSGDVLEKKGASVTLEKLGYTDIALFIIDATESLTVQDSRIISILIAKGVSIVIVINKWDIVDDKTQKLAEEVRDQVHRRLPYATWIPLVFVSAKTGLRANKIMPLMITIAAERRRRITNNALDKFLKSCIKKQKPQKGKGTKTPFVHHIVQTRINPPTFIATTSAKADLSESYRRFLENQLREKFGFTGTPVQVCVEKKKILQATR